MKQSVLMMAMVLLTGCLDQTSIQSDYVSERNDCQGEAEGHIGDYAEGQDDTDIHLRNAKLVTLFSDCMFDRGWTVAAPEKPLPADPPILDARTKAVAATDNSVGVGDTIKPGKDVQQRYVAPVQSVPAQPLPPAPAGYYYQLTPLPVPSPAGAPE